jgi:hypothetical protein
VNGARVPYYVGRTGRNDVNERLIEHQKVTPKGVRFNPKEDHAEVLKTGDLTESQSASVEEFTAGETGTIAGRGNFPMNQRHEVSESQSNYRARTAEAQQILNGEEEPGTSAAWGQVHGFQEGVRAAAGANPEDEILSQQAERMYSYSPMYNFTASAAFSSGDDK